MGLRVAIAIAIVTGAAAPATSAPVLVGLGPDADARKVIAIGPGGQVYEPDGTGAWTRTRQIATATTLTSVERSADGVVASGGGVIYKLARNGWSAIRLAQKGAAVLSRGPRTVGAVGRQLYALDRWRAGEPEKLALATATIRAIGSGTSIVVATDRGVFRVAGRGKPTAISRTSGIRSFVGDRWALATNAAIDLRSGKRTAFPNRARVAAARATADDRLHVVATVANKLVVLEVSPNKPVREIRVEADVARPRAVDVVVDRAGRIVIALADGRLVLKTGTTWATTEVRDALPAPRPGAPPATSP